MQLVVLNTSHCSEALVAAGPVQEDIYAAVSKDRGRMEDRVRVEDRVRMEDRVGVEDRDPDRTQAEQVRRIF